MTPTSSNATSSSDTTGSCSTDQHANALARIVDVIAQLRDPQTGCPWDLEQTHVSLKPYLLEEAYETLAAIDTDAARPNPHTRDDLCQELGDVLLQVLLHAQIAQDEGRFTLTDVANALSDKLIRRHPHVFASQTNPSVETAHAVTQQWQAIKAQEKEAKKADSTESAPATQSILDAVATGQPALSRALDVSKRAVAVGFEWPDFESLWACVMSEYDELRRVMADPTAANYTSRLEDEMGDIFFASVNLARHLKVHPEVALTRATDKFIKRFKRMEALAPTALETLDFATWDALWQEAKHTTAQETAEDA